MFFPERIKNILSTDRVLEIGPGGNPHFRADVILEKRYADDVVYEQQRGYSVLPKMDERFVLYDGGVFPFKDNEFDYIICSHVLEHIPKQDIDLFISEMLRVGRAGYVEVPNFNYEVINNQEVHLWYIACHERTFYFLPKEDFPEVLLFDPLRKMASCNDKYYKSTYRRYREFYFDGFEWSRENPPLFEVVENWKELLRVEILHRNENYFSSFKKMDYYIYRLKLLSRKILKKLGMRSVYVG